MPVLRSSVHAVCVVWSHSCNHPGYIKLGSFQSTMLHDLLLQVVSEVMSRDLKMEVDDELMQAAKH